MRGREGERERQGVSERGGVERQRDVERNMQKDRAIHRRFYDRYYKQFHMGFNNMKV